MVREWDPRTASDAEIQSTLELFNAVLAADLPTDPRWRDSHFREYLSEIMPGERRLTWIALDPAGPGPRVVGRVSLLLFGDIGVVELVVHPAARRRRLGRRLLAEAARRAHREGFSSIGVEVVAGTPAASFFPAAGFRCAYVETRSVLSLSEVDWLALGEMAQGIGAGYQVQFHPGAPPDELLESYAMVKAEVRGSGGADLTLRPSSYDPQRLRESLHCLVRRGMQPYIVLAIHSATGEVAGLTEVVVPAQHPTRADQYDTVVAADHRGYGIDRAIKARMLFELRSAAPSLTEVQTWNAPDNEAMLKVNAELGFRPDREWREYEADVAELVRLLDRADRS
ncbi:MAG TPA: GNAT family N-acetyltransferase [Pilimelia sp.]|nr:GNAT family N-acetyltransferase [Pilimelia sp.]